METPTPQAPPVLLTVAEALMYAAQRLEEEAASLQLVELMLNVIPAEKRAGDNVVEKIMRDAPELPIQIKARRDAAAVIKQLGIDIRVATAKAGQPI